MALPAGARRVLLAAKNGADMSDTPILVTGAAGGQQGSILLEGAVRAFVRRIDQRSDELSAGLKRAGDQAGGIDEMLEVIPRIDGVAPQTLQSFVRERTSTDAGS